MSEPVVFVSHFRIKEGKLDALGQLFREVTKALEGEKPRTLVFLSYINEGGTEASFVHVFADADSMDLHVQGAEERTRKALEFLEPEGFEIYGRPSDRVMEMMREAAVSGAELGVQSKYLGGFIRPTPG